MHANAIAASLGLGIDMGGTQTRWALANQEGRLLHEGVAPGATALQLFNTEGKETLAQLFTQMAEEIANASVGELSHIQAGLTGYSGESHEIKKLLCTAFKIAESAITVSNDIEVAYLDVFSPGEGYLVYAGTGSIAAYIDKTGQFHRAGGHGYVLDDAGSGHWIAREALKFIWREEDFNPGRWRSSPMAQAVFEHIGGDDWKHTREFIYQGARGDIGKLAIAVASAADKDNNAQVILANAGMELARLGKAMCVRFGEKPIALSGRVQFLHPVIAQTMRAHLPSHYQLRLSESAPHHAAARMAAKTARCL
jgi:glucosamine kinase